jgi:hypothetical protein
MKDGHRSKRRRSSAGVHAEVTYSTYLVATSLTVGFSQSRFALLGKTCRRFIEILPHPYAIPTAPSPYVFMSLSPTQRPVFE